MGRVVSSKSASNKNTEVLSIQSPPPVAGIPSVPEGTILRKKVADWDEYVRMQEAIAWQYVRRYADRMQPAFELAAKNDESVGARYPALERFFATATGIARKSAATRKANQTLVAEGKMPFKGGVGKRRKRSAANKALGAQLAAGQKPASQPAPATHGTRDQRSHADERRGPRGQRPQRGNRVAVRAVRSPAPGASASGAGRSPHTACYRTDFVTASARVGAVRPISTR